MTSGTPPTEPDRRRLAAPGRLGWSWWLVKMGLALARRPDLWLTGLGAMWALAQPGWWRRWPPLPLPPSSYLAFRLSVAYGEGDRTPRTGDVVSYLIWRRDFQRLN
ncbi:MAG: hypothetical protein ACT4OS_06150 [Acidimicrobiales bacterium]